MSVTYTDNNVPIGSFAVALKRGGGAGTAVATYVAENLTFNRPSTVIQRKDEVGKENGWTLQATVGDTGSGTLQIATATTETPKQGDWFALATDGASTATQHWVLTEVGQPFAQDAYYKVNVNIKYSANPPTS